MAWAAIAGVALGAALAAGAHEPAPVSAADVSAARVSACVAGGAAHAVCSARSLSSR